MANTNRAVIITGANGNLGSAVTKTFLDKGYSVIATVAEESMKKDFSPHHNLEVMAVNLMEEDAAGSFVRSVTENYESLEGALLLVGGFTSGAIANTHGADVRKQIALNFETAFFVARPVFLHMLMKGKGRIVLIGARPALVAAAGKDLIAYGLSKSLLFKLAEYLNAEAKGKNVVVTVVAPSTLDTPLNRKSMPDADPENWVKPSALAEILEFIVSDRSGPLRETVLKVYNNS
jgi:NAD(P)-dependent dehydrogenase (short-subunit alcohol dehydrogenase family)